MQNADSTCGGCRFYDPRQTPDLGTGACLSLPPHPIPVPRQGLGGVELAIMAAERTVATDRRACSLFGAAPQLAAAQADADRRQVRLAWKGGDDG